MRIIYSLTKGYVSNTTIGKHDDDCVLYIEDQCMKQYRGIPVNFGAQLF